MISLLGFLSSFLQGTALRQPPRQGSIAHTQMGVCWTQLFGDQTEEQEIGNAGKITSGNVHLITTIQGWEQKLSEANKDGKIVVANFTASWCHPCMIITPTYCELADKYPSLLFLSVDVDDLAEFSTQWGIKATPTFFFLKDGKQVDKFVGGNKVELIKKMATFVESANSWKQDQITKEGMELKNQQPNEDEKQNECCKSFRPCPNFFKQPNNSQEILPRENACSRVHKHFCSSN